MSICSRCVQCQEASEMGREPSQEGLKEPVFRASEEAKKPPTTHQKKDSN